MEKRGLEPDVVSFTTVINAHARAGNTQEAQAWLDAMVTRGKAPDSYACNAVCAAHARVGDAAAAMRCLARMADYGAQFRAGPIALVLPHTPPRNTHAPPRMLPPHMLRLHVLHAP